MTSELEALAQRCAALVAERDRLRRAVGEIYFIAIMAEGVFGSTVGDNIEIAAQADLTLEELAACIAAAEDAEARP